ncbi:hypothetical protein GQ457_10G023320 [Hibiscus cannabinus]
MILFVEGNKLHYVFLQRNSDGVPSIVHSIVEVLDRSWCIRISHIARGGNSVADWMTKLASSEDLVCHRYLSPPTGISLLRFLMRPDVPFPFS